MLYASELKPVMDDQVREVVEVLKVPASAAAILMREHKWAKERLFDRFWDNSTKVQEKCGVLARCQNSIEGASGSGGEEKAAAGGVKRSTRSSKAKLRHCL